MNTVYIGNAVGDEHGKASGGEPGDQTGKELKIQPWYKNKKGWRVFRPKSPEVAAMLVYDMTVACESPFIGYDQKQRNTLYQAAKSVGFDCAKVTDYCECDCSSLVRVCVLYAGIKINDFNTTSEPTRLLATGEFDEMVGEEYTDSPNKLSAGMILCTKVKGHTAIVLNDGPDAEPYPDPPVPPTPPDPPEPPEPPAPPEPTKYIVYVTGRSVNVRETDEMNSAGKPVGKILFTAHKGNRFNLIDISADTGWYHIETYKGPAYISNREDLTCLITIS